MCVCVCVCVVRWSVCGGVCGVCVQPQAAVCGGVDRAMPR